MAEGAALETDNSTRFDLWREAASEGGCCGAGVAWWGVWSPPLRTTGKLACLASGAGLEPCWLQQDVCCRGLGCGTVLLARVGGARGHVGGVCLCGSLCCRATWPW